MCKVVLEKEESLHSISAKATDNTIDFVMVIVNIMELRGVKQGSDTIKRHYLEAILDTVKLLASMDL